MGFVQDILALVLPGALFNLVAHAARLRLRRAEGYALLFYTLLAGWMIQGAAWLLNGLLLTVWEWTGLGPFVLEAGGYRAATITGGLLLALFAATVVNRFWSMDRVSMDVAADSGEFRELTYQVAIVETSPVEVTLETSKVYVGIPLASRLAMKDESDLWLVLLMSGHRDERQELTITTNYTAKFREDDLDVARSLPLGGFVVALPKNRIVSARPFDVGLYEEAFRQYKDWEPGHTTDIGYANHPDHTP